MPHAFTPSQRTRAAEIDAAAVRIAALREAGEPMGDDVVRANHPDLMPELLDEVRAIRDIHTAMMAARRMGPIYEPLPEVGDAVDDAPFDEQLALAEAAAAAEDGAPPDADALNAGLRIAGYVVLAKLGDGGQATVYRAKQLTTGRTVAVKVLPGGPYISTRSRKRFDKEIGFLATLDHPNIVGVLERGRTADGSHFLVMPFVDGAHLDDYLTAAGLDGTDPLPVLRLFAKVARAVEAAHKGGVVHRDLKPSNVLVDAGGEPHVVDFGLAKRIDAAAAAAASLTPDGQVFGSLPWSSPEHVDRTKGPVGVRSDVYSIGVMLYRALAGQSPYPVEGAIRQVMDNIERTHPGPPSRLRRQWSARRRDAIDAVVLRALAKDPAERYPTAAALAAAIEDCVAGRSVEPAVQTRRARRRVAWMTGLAATVMVAATAASMRFAPKPRTPQLVAALPHKMSEVGLRLVRIPEGTFSMGSAPTENGRGQNERKHMVTVERPFYLSTTEVSEGQFQAVMGGDRPARGTLPAVVSWADATAFCETLSRREKRRYRLPTEAEWERACRAGSDQRFGAATGEPEEFAWFADNAGGQRRPVGGKQPNVWGLHDLQGNVSEWCADAYFPGYDPETAENPSPGGSRVLRGGSFRLPADACRAAFRTFSPPDDVLGAGDVGFRVAMDPLDP